MGIVVGYLATDEGRAALEAGAVEALQRGVRLVVVASARASVDDAKRAELEDELSRVGVELAARGVEHQLRLVAAGKDVAEDLIAAAVEIEASLIVIGLRRRSPVGKLILGSNAQRILLDAPCPVLAVKPVRV
ncbi:universal stress protein [mine drainage metagenome]|uniref:Universal stress protein n=1 Tax=mine drainage metagenome TaxID=410659 RepID=A0A1J5RBX9_9ZZZZ